ncbi:hypothetical protein DPMN_125362 [Dreissena polymorpha]|uniref:Uncharacterized protein n=1 Tax=Dreissena polymorpha TaxID=45954 RepID=A0A9D4GV02_DREPO|nr:hypothetical protein DPMN_125362 [Dreissena polymorpha]
MVIPVGIEGLLAPDNWITTECILSKWRVHWKMDPILSACTVFVSDVTDSGKPQCWGFSYEELEKAQEEDGGQLLFASPEELVIPGILKATVIELHHVIPSSGHLVSWFLCECFTD